jgi:regulator of protease activity HflC (stomatin/prohibitin superfamily)
MISTTLFFIALAVGGYSIWKATYNVPAKDRQFPLKGVIIIVGGTLLAAIQPFNIERVDAGHVGIKVKLTGNSRGVSKYEYKTGWVMYNSWTEQLYEFPTFQQHIDYDEQSVITKGGFTAVIKPSFNYALKAHAVGDMFQNLRLDIESIQQGWLKTAIVGAVNDVANKWEVDRIFNEREQFESAIVAECNKRLSKWFLVSQLRTNILPPASLQEAIEAKTQAIQQAQAEDQKALTAEAEARKKIAQAKGDSAQVVIEASAAAKAMQIKQMQLTPLYVEYMKIQKWNGQTPTTVLGNGTSTLVNVK